MKRVLYLAAHGGFAGQAVPLGGGAAIANLLCRHWNEKAPFELQLVSPSILGGSAPGARDLVAYNEREYARFCHAFRDASTEVVLRHDPAGTVVLVNDISEGPDFRRLHDAGFPIVTIYHVDVVAYIASIYLRGWMSAAALARTWERLRPALRAVTPPILDLIFEQQRDSLLYSRRVIVPSTGMRDVLLAGYPDTPADRVEVLPWGALPAAFDDCDIDAAARDLRRRHGVPDDARILLCLSRISPEKGQDLLLDALIEIERRGECPAEPLWLFVCGEPAFMQGTRHMAKLKRLAARLRRVRVVFPGYVTGLAKDAWLRMAGLYVFPSRHESYGLTMVEALAAGKPCLALDHHGARDVLTHEIGRVVDSRHPVAGLRKALVELLGDPRLLADMGDAARAWAAANPFCVSVQRLEAILGAGHTEDAVRSNAPGMLPSGSTRPAAPF